MAKSQLQIIEIGKGDVHVSVDAEETFGSNGDLAVPGGSDIVEPTKKTIEIFDENISVQEVHPYGHISLASSLRSSLRGRAWPDEWLYLEQVIRREMITAPHALFTIDELREYVLRMPDQRMRLWTDHSLMGGPKTRLLDGLTADMFRMIFHKGMNPKVDSYSAFRDALRQSTGLTALLDTMQCRRIFFTGLAYDFCVGYSAIDAAIDGFEAYIIKSGTRAVGIPANGSYPGSIAVIEAEFKRFGVKIIEDVSQLRRAA